MRAVDFLEKIGVKKFKLASHSLTTLDCSVHGEQEKTDGLVQAWRILMKLIVL